MSEKIDAVITWVDGDDPRHRAKRQQFGTQRQFSEENVAGDTRFKSLGEIFYCVASINRFAPWINKIYIVTDEQNPNLEPFLEHHFPEGYIPMEIVDHKVIFRGYYVFALLGSKCEIQAIYIIKAATIVRIVACCKGRCIGNVKCVS